MLYEARRPPVADGYRRQRQVARTDLYSVLVQKPEHDARWRRDGREMRVPRSISPDTVLNHDGISVSLHARRYLPKNRPVDGVSVHEPKQHAFRAPAHVNAATVVTNERLGADDLGDGPLLSNASGAAVSACSRRFQTERPLCIGIRDGLDSNTAGNNSHERVCSHGFRRENLVA